MHSKKCLILLVKAFLSNRIENSVLEGNLIFDFPRVSTSLSMIYWNLKKRKYISV